MRRAGELADGFMGTEVTPESLAEQARLGARGARARRAATRRTFEWSVHLPTFAWHGDDAWERVREHQWYVTWKYEDMDQARGRTGPAADAPAVPGRARGRRCATASCSARPSRWPSRSPRCRTPLGAPLHYIARLYWPGMDPAVRDEAMRIFAEEVRPLLR